MKKIALFVCAFVALAGLSALAQESTTTTKSQTKSTTTKTPSASKTETIRGTISSDGKSLVADKDNKSWTIANPEAVKGHEGHHVAAKGTVDSSKDEINVSSVTMVGGAKGKKKSAS